MTPLNNIQKDRGCTVGPGCVGGECSCRRTVRLVLEGLKEPDPSLHDAAWSEAANGADPPEVFHAVIDTALKEVG